MHSRFEHSLGVMHIASSLYDSIVASSSDVLKSVYRYTDVGLSRDRQKVRLAALLHDVGHSPFSHASEDVFPEKPQPAGDATGVKQGSKHYRHEQYSCALIRSALKDAIDGDEWNRRNYGITADEVAAIIEGNPSAGPALFWKDLLSGQLDADRMDYLLRDSYHVGVNYGKYDLHRLVSTVRAFEDSTREQKTPRIGVSSGGSYAAEALILARYYMHRQVYFHKTRLAYDIHLQHVMQNLLPGGSYPPPTEDGLRAYLDWDDWRVLGLLAQGQGGEHGERLLSRRHYRLIYGTPDNANDIEALGKQRADLRAIKEALGELVVETRSFSHNWYKLDATDIPVVTEHDPKDVRPLSECSILLGKLSAGEQELLFVKPEDVAKAKELVDEALAKRRTSQLKMDFPAQQKKEVASA